MKFQIKLKQNLMLHLDDALFVMMTVCHTGETETHFFSRISYNVNGKRVFLLSGSLNMF